MGKTVKFPILVAFKCCLRCGCEKPASAFGVDKRATDRLKGECKECRNAQERERHKNWTPEQRQKHNARGKAYKLANEIGFRAIHLYNSAQTRSKQKGWKFSLSKAAIRVVLTLGFCQRSGLPFRYETISDAWRNPMGPSIDRKDNAQPYIDGNVQIVCNMYNSGKGETDDLTFIAFCMAVAEQNKDNQAVLQRLREMRSL